MSKISESISQKRRGHLDFCAVKCKNQGLASQLLGFSIYSISGVKFDLILSIGPTQSVLRNLARHSVKHKTLEHLEAAGPQKKWLVFFSSSSKCLPGYPLLTSLKVCDRSGRIFGASASPRSLTKKKVMSPSSSVHGGQDDSKYVICLLYTSPSPRDGLLSRMPSSA